MKKIFTLILFTGLWSTNQAQTINQQPKKCATSVLPEQFETKVQQWIAEMQLKKTQSVNYTLPVIVHVIHGGEAIGTGANISNAQIQSQIDVLNNDFAGLNADSSLIPTVFKPFFAHSGISFCLAQTDTNGIALSEPGVNRIDIIAAGGIAGPYTKDYIDTIIKPNSIWNPNKYLNFWCLDLGNSLLGYATFPDPASTTVAGLPAPYGEWWNDGVVIKNNAFGTIGNVAAPYDLGRTATHEVGHWLGLRHIWGDTICGTDYCMDTPPTQNANSGCPVHPLNVGLCTGNTSGEMFMNHMDYSNDACLHMFTNDQKSRMIAILNGSPMRANLAVSDKCNIPTTIKHITASNNVRLYPNPNNGVFAISLQNYTPQTNLVIYNNLGQVVLQQSLDSLNTEINMEHYAKGIYQINIKENETIIYRTKIIKY